MLVMLPCLPANNPCSLHCSCATLAAAAAAVAVYNLVLKLQQHALSKIKPGVAWADIQQSTRHLLLEQLLQLGLVKGSLDALTEAGIDRVFMPHGLGHFLGLDVHDVSARTLLCNLEYVIFR
jgi:Xaa-Pro aminopeptidase